ncbi:unnamed protein product [Clonostachys byssicola]|uniref:Uncharacterized protein n=1 Tax=Clonostachys byssicola TaxID=160290 RepID=A0A9N9UUG0_9HYPO|nr:unnamed protein product [Clonostachys byssicola]
MDAFGVASTSFQLLQILFELRTCLKHQPLKFNSWDEELSCLDRTITSVRENPKLHTILVKTILERVVAKAKALKNLLERLSPVHQKKKFDIQKITNILTAKSNESQILKHFADLERYKTTLMLAISTINSSNLENPEKTSMWNTKPRKDRRTLALSRPKDPLADHPNWKKILWELIHTSAEQPQPQPMNNHQYEVRQRLEQTPTPTASNPTSTGASDTRGKSAATVVNVMSGNISKGNKCSLSISHPLGGTIEENRFEGHQRLDGFHGEGVMKAYITNVQAAELMDIDEKEEVEAERQPSRRMPFHNVDSMDVDGNE